MTHMGNIYTVLGANAVIFNKKEFGSQFHYCQDPEIYNQAQYARAEKGTDTNKNTHTVPIIDSHNPQTWLLDLNILSSPKKTFHKVE